MTDNQTIHMARLYGTPIQKKNAEIEYRFTIKQLKMLLSTTIIVERQAVLDLVDAYAKNNHDLRDAIRARGEA